jgi:hypothetical protein
VGIKYTHNITGLVLTRGPYKRATELTDELKEMLHDFIATSFMGNQGKLLGHHYHSVMT